MNNEEYEKEKERMRREILAEMEKDQMRKEILDELNTKGRENPNSGSETIQAFGQVKKKSSVSFNKENSEERLQKEEIVEDEVPALNVLVSKPSSSKASKLVLVVCAVIAIAAIASFPMIYREINNYIARSKDEYVEMPKEEEKVPEKITMDSEAFQNLKYPIMHNDPVTKDTYFSRDKISVSDFSNNDILFRALVDVLEGNMANYNGKYSGNYCGAKNTKVSLDADYLELRIQGLFSRNTKYQLTDFAVPMNRLDTKYVGTWKYDAPNQQFIYYGCGTKTNTGLNYYDVSVPYEVTTSEKNVNLYVDSYVAFAAVNPSNKAYILYKDAAYTEELSRGTLTTNTIDDELKTIVKNTDATKLNKYKYTYTIEGCPYLDYCFASGEWIK